MPDSPRRTRIDETDAKAGSTEGVVRWVLLISLALAIIALTVIWVTGALTQNADESQMNVARKQQAEAARADDNADLAEEAGLVAPGTSEQPQSPAPAPAPAPASAPSPGN